MPCYKPLTAWYAKEVNRSGKRSMVFNPRHALEPDAPVELPCGQCVGCRLDRSRSWAIRCIHEASLHEENCFITLTFSPEALAARENPGSLDVRDFQLFMKRLRKHFEPRKVRFFHCGEYGDKYGRPHYHAILFGIDFSDKEFLMMRNGLPLFRSATLESLWPFGFSSIGTVTFESAAYVARYILKKVTGKHAWHHYSDIDYSTGEIINTRSPEYTTMSRRPGIAADWFEKYSSDIYPKDFITVRGRKMRPPKFYDKLFERIRPLDMEDIRAERVASALVYADNNTPERLAVREEVQIRKLDHLPRLLDSED